MDKQLPLPSFLALAAIGWADGSLQRIEREGLLRAAKECGIEGADLATLEKASTEHRSLDGVELGGLTRWEQVLTYALASWFAALDGVISTSEQETLVTIGNQLGLDDSLRKRASAAANDIACLPGGGRPDRYDFVKLVARLKERLPQLERESVEVTLDE
jgi:hypothetical protein